MRAVFRCGCFKTEDNQKNTKQKSTEPTVQVDYTKLVNRNTSYLVAEFQLTNSNDYLSGEKLVMSGTPHDMHREYFKMKENTKEYAKTLYPRHNLFKVLSINVYNAADADLRDYSSKVEHGPPGPIYLGEQIEQHKSEVVQNP